MSRWCSHELYLLALAEGGDRINADGSLATRVTEAEQEEAKKRLKRGRRHKAKGKDKG